MEDPLSLQCAHPRRAILLAALCCALAATRSSAADPPLTVCDEPSLRAALDQGGRIQFGCDGVINLTQPLVIAKDTILDGAGHAVTLSGSNTVRVLTVGPGVQFTLISVTVANGRSSQGGGLFNDGGIVTLAGCIFSNNVAIGANGNNGTNNTGSYLLSEIGAAAGGDGEPGEDAAGGAIYSRGGLTLTNISLIQNRALGGKGGNGGLGGQVVSIFPMVGALGAAAQGGSGLGGGLFHESGSLRVIDSRLVSSSAQGGKGGSGAPVGLGGVGGLGAGGAIYAGGELELTSSTLSSNTVMGGAGGDGATSYPGIVGADAVGGGVYSTNSLQLASCCVSSNRAVGGIGGVGGNVWDPIHNLPGANMPSGSGGSGRAAGLYCAGPAAFVNSTLVANTAEGGAGAGAGYLGKGGNGGNGTGGGLVCSQNRMGLTNCTLAANLTQSGPAGPAGNQSGTAGTNGVAIPGGSIFNEGAELTLINTIVANSPGGNVAGPIVDAGHNLSTDYSCGFTSPTSLSNMDPKLGTLANNGGLTSTLALLDGSPAIDHADPTASPPVDQRGVTRPIGAGYDIGAFEASESLPTVSLQFSPLTITPGQTSVLTLTLSNATAGTISGQIRLDASLRYAGDAATTNDCGGLASLTSDGTIVFTNVTTTLNPTCLWQFPVTATNEGRFLALAEATSDTMAGRTVTSVSRLAVTGNPTAITELASLTADAGGTFYGLANPAGLATAVAFEYGGTASYGLQTPWQSVGGDFDPLLVTAQLTNLVITAPIHYRAVGTNANGLFYGPDQIVPSPAIVTNCDEFSLRQAIQAGGVFRLNCDVPIALTSPLVITNDTVLDGTGHAVVFDGLGSNRLVEVQSGAKLTLIKLSLANGRSDRGGALYLDHANAVLVDCVFTHNWAAGPNGVPGRAASTNALSVPGGNGTKGGLAYGGAIYTTGGQIAVVGCSFIDNVAQGGGGGVGGAAVSGYFGGSGAQFGGNGGAGGEAFGGGIYSLDSSLLVIGCLGNGNQALGGSAGSAGAGALGGEGAVASGGWIYQQAGDLVFRQSQARSNAVVGGRGGLGGSNNYATGNAGGSGGGANGAALFSSGRAHVSGGLFEANSAAGGQGGDSGGGGIVYSVPSGAVGGSAQGVAVYNQGAMVIENSFLYRDSAVGGSGGVGGPGGGVNGVPGNGGDGGHGGAASGSGIYNSTGDLTLLNVTIDAEQTTGGAGGAGGLPGTFLFYVGAPGKTGALGAAAGLTIVNDRGTALAINSILGASGVGTNCVGAITDGGHNLCSDNSAGFTSLTSANNIDARLQWVPSDQRGQPALVPLPDSPAIDAGDDALAPRTDFRGVPRPIGKASDIGAFELVPPPVIAVQTNGIELSIVLQPRQSISVEASANLVDWVPLTETATDANGVLQFEDPNTTNDLARFYRFITR